jgi:hypothetical protein
MLQVLCSLKRFKKFLFQISLIFYFKNNPSEMQNFNTLSIIFPAKTFLLKRFQEQ